MTKKYTLYTACLLYIFIFISACSSQNEKQKNSTETTETTETIPTQVLQTELSPAAIKGKRIFMANCSACHLMSNEKLVGPGMKGVTEKYDKEWLIKFISNSQKMIAEGDEKAVKVYQEYNQTVMSNFQFTDEQYDFLLAYLKEGGK